MATTVEIPEKHERKPMNMVARREKVQLQKVFLAIAAVIFALLIGEAAARVLLPAWYPRPQSHHRLMTAGKSRLFIGDPEIGWVVAADATQVKGRGLAPDGTFTGHALYSVGQGERLTSRLAHRGPLILVTGDSFTFGKNVDDQDTWPWLLQEQLPAYHVVNVAANGYGTDQALLAAERRALRSPGEVRTVVLGFNEVQIDRNRSTQKWLASTVPFGRPRFVLEGGQARYQGVVQFRSLGSFGDAIVDHSMLLTAMTNVAADHLIYRIEGHEGGRRLTVAMIRDFAQRFASRGIKFVVVVLPMIGDEMETAKADREFVVNQMRLANIPTFVMDIPRLANDKIDWHRFGVGFHPSPQYNLLLANQVQEFLGTLNPPEGWNFSFVPR